MLSETWSMVCDAWTHPILIHVDLLEGNERGYWTRTRKVGVIYTFWHTAADVLAWVVSASLVCQCIGDGPIQRLEVTCAFSHHHLTHGVAWNLDRRRIPSAEMMI